MENALLSKITARNLKSGHPEFRPGDTIRVHVKIKEGDKERLQAFEGTVIARNNKGVSETITVRKVSFGQGVERIFPLHAPVVDHIDVVQSRPLAGTRIIPPANGCRPAVMNALSGVLGTALSRGSTKPDVAPYSVRYSRPR